MKWIKLTKETLPTIGMWYITKREYDDGSYGEVLQINFDPSIDNIDRFLQHYAKDADVFYLDESGSEPEGKEAVEFAEFTHNDNDLFNFQSGMWQAYPYTDQMPYLTTEQLFKIWKAEAK